MRTLDDVYGPDLDRFPLEQEAFPPSMPLIWEDMHDLPIDAIELRGIAQGRMHWGLFGSEN